MWVQATLIRFVLSVSLIALTACQTLNLPSYDSSKLDAIDAAIKTAIAEKKTPGGVFWLEHRGQRFAKAYGNKSIEPEIVPTKINTIYDSASITKVVATTPAIMLLIEQEEILLDAPVTDYLDGFDNGGKETITIRHLMTHSSGLRPGIGLTVEVNGEKQSWEGYDTAIELAKSEHVRQEPGTGFIYSDINFILLGEIIQQVTGRKLEDFTREEVFEPLGMKSCYQVGGWKNASRHRQQSHLQKNGRCPWPCRHVYHGCRLGTICTHDLKRGGTRRPPFPKA
jgi:CubicO group peptidase (beta-lactamase class C family)